MNRKSESFETKSFDQLKKALNQLLESFEVIDTSSLAKPERDILTKTISRTRGFFSELEIFIFSVAKDLELTKRELNKSSDELLGRASEQLGEVTESTQKVANQVMDRIDGITDRQNSIFERIGEIREYLQSLDAGLKAESVIESTAQIEALENEIQTEAFEIMNEMQFQDITTQQINHANNLIGEAEKKLVDFGQVLALVSGKKKRKARVRAPTGGEVAFDSSATLEKREERQLLADEISTLYGKKK